MDQKEKVNSGTPLGASAPGAGVSPSGGPRRLRPLQLVFLLLLVVATVWIIRGHIGFSTDTMFVRKPQPTFRTGEGTIFGTIYHTTYEAPVDLADSIQASLQRVDSTLSMFNPESLLSRINRGETQQMDTMLATVMQLALRVSRATDGAFDVTVAPLVNAWGFGYKHGQLPTDSQVDSLRQLVGYQHLTIRGLELKSDLEGQVIDLSAIAKGYAADVVGQMFRRNNVANYMIEIGGEIVVAGSSPKGEAWRIGVEQPVDDSTSLHTETQTVLPLTDCGMATSGNYRNFHVDADGRRRAHTIDPHTGRPVQHSVLSATVVARTSAEADAYATAFMVMGLDGAQRVLKAQPHLRAYLIYDTKQGNKVFRRGL